MFFVDSKPLQEETIICYIDYKGWRFSGLYATAYLLTVTAVSYLVNIIGHMTFPTLLFTYIPFLFGAGLVFGMVSIVLFTLKNNYIWAGSVQIFQGHYSPGMLIQDLSVLCIHGAVCVSFYARCKAGMCENEQIPFCNPKDDIHAYPFGHAHLLLMLPLLTRSIINSCSFGAIFTCWGMCCTALLLGLVKFELKNGSIYYIGHTLVILYAVYVIEALNYERYKLCQRTGVNPAEDASIDSPPRPKLSRSDSMSKLRRTGSFSSRPTSASSVISGYGCPKLLGIPYVFVSDLLSPTKFMKDSTKSLLQLVSSLSSVNDNKDDNEKSSATKQQQISALTKKMDMVLNQAVVCSSLLSMQMNLAGDIVKHDLSDAVRPKAQSVNISSVLMDCISVAKSMQKVVSLSVLSAPKGDLISGVLGDADWISESLHCMICNAIRMSSPKGTVYIVVDIIDDVQPNTDDGRMVKVSDIEQGRPPTTKIMRIMVDTDAGTAVKNGMAHPIEITSPWSEFMNKETDGCSVSGAPQGPGGKKCHNGAAGLCMRGITYRCGAMDGEYDVRLGRIPHKKTKEDQGKSSLKIDYNNQLSVSGGCHFVFSIPYKSGGGLPSVSMKPILLQKQRTSNKILSTNDNVEPSRRGNQTNLQPRPDQTNIMHDTKPNKVVGKNLRAQEQRNLRDIDNDNNGNDKRRHNDDLRGNHQLKRQPTKFDVAPSKMVMQVASKFDRRGNYGISDSDSDDDMEIQVVKDPRMQLERKRRLSHGDDVNRKKTGVAIENMRENLNNMGILDQNGSDRRPPQQRRRQEHHSASQDQYSPHRERMNRSFHGNAESYESPQADDRRNYRKVINELNSSNWRKSNDQIVSGGRHQRSFRTSFNSVNVSNEVSAVDEAIEMLTKAKEKLSHGSSFGDNNPSPFAIPYKINQRQSVLLIIPGNIQDSKDAASKMISGLKDAGKEVQLESNFVYALNMLLSGATYDVIVMDASQCNTFEATEFVRRLRAWEKTLVKQGGRETHQFVAAITLDDVVLNADEELHSGVDTILAPPVNVTAVMDILNIIKILSIN